jgi:hypothetical protein
VTCPRTETVVEDIDAGAPADRPPGIRRLCVAVASASHDLLREACGRAGIGRIYVYRDDEVPCELGLAAPGIDEPDVVDRLIAVLGGLCGESGVSADLALHVGLTRIEDDRFDGTTVRRSSVLLRALRANPERASGTGELTVIVPSELFCELQYEWRTGEAWTPFPEASAWTRAYLGSIQR